MIINWEEGFSAGGGCEITTADVCVFTVYSGSLLGPCVCSSLHVSTLQHFLSHPLLTSWNFLSHIMFLNKARPLCDLIKLNTILAQEYVAGKASTGTHVSSDLLNTGRFYMALYPPTGILTSRLRGYLSSTTSRGHLGTTYMVSPKDKYRDI